MEPRKLSIQLEDTQLELVATSITELGVEAVVNTTDSEFEMQTDVAKQILAKGGASIREECLRIGQTPVGTAVITGAGDLDAKHVIHAVGPVMGEGEEDRKLQSAVRSALALADRHGLRSISLPPISTGDGGYPMDRCARILLTEVYRYLQGGTKIERVAVALETEENFEIFKRELRRGFR